MGIDRSVQSGLKSSASHGVHGQAVGVGRSVRSQPNGSQPLALTAWNVMGEYLCRKLPADTGRTEQAWLFFCLTLADAGYVTLSLPCSCWADMMAP